MEELFIPATGMAMEEAVLLEWLHQPGDVVAAGEPVAVIETDKATVDVTTEAGGVLGEHLAEAGAHVKVGVPIVRVLAPGETSPAASGPQPAAAATPPAAHGGVSPDVDAAPAPDGTATGFRQPHKLTPRQRRVLREQAQAAAQERPAAPAPPVAPAAPIAPAAPVSGPPSTPAPPAAAQQQPRSRADRASESVARAVSQSWSTIPHFAVSREIDMTDLLHYLEGVRRTDPQVSVTDLLLQATARAWRSLRPDGRDGAGLSVATERRVINISVPGAAELPLPELARRRRQAVDRARRGVLSPADFTTVDITVSNLGTHGVDWFTGVIPLNQVALLTIGRIRSGLEVSPRAVRIRQLMWVTANLDHRHLDGADGAALLEAFTQACTVSPGQPTWNVHIADERDA